MATNSLPQHDDLAFLAGGGAAATAIRARDWWEHPLGPPEQWPTELRTSLSLVLNSPESMFLAWGPEFHLFYNDAYAPAFGARLPQAVGARFRDVWPDGWERTKPILDAAVDGDSRRYVDAHWLLNRGGEPEDTWWSFSYSRVLDGRGKVAGLLAVSQETTDRVRRAAEAEAAERRNRQVVDSAIDYAIIATDMDGRVTRWNKGAQHILGWDEAEMLGQDVERFFTPEDLAIGRPATEMRCALETGRSNDERWHRRKSGERFWATGELTPLRDVDGVVVGFVKVLRDRTDQRLADEALRDSEARLAAALTEVQALNRTLEGNVAERTAERDRLWDASPDLLVLIDFEGRIRSVNPAWSVILGYAPEELVGRFILKLVHPDDRERLMRAVLKARSGPVSPIESRHRHRDGSYRWFSWLGAASGPTIYATGRHITAEKNAREALRDAEEQLRQAQKVEAVGQLTGGVAHDFNNLLTVIRGSVDLLRRPGLSEERRARYIEAIADTADRAARLTSQLLAFARRQALKPEVFDAGQSVAAVSEMVATLSGARVKVTVKLPDQPCFINADRSQFDTAIVNMAVNARDAMGGEGSLTITVAASDGMPAVRLHAPVPGTFVSVSLTDTGGGIASAQIDRIFEPFFTTKSVGHGTGLGLSQVFGFAKQSGGEIAVSSIAGEGATFTLYLPLALEPPPEHVEAGVQSSGSLAALRVLVVEDNSDVGAFAVQVLVELGHHVVLAGDAALALAELDTRGTDAFDVVFSDVLMPGMSGIELAEEIARRAPELPVVLTSGYSSVLAQNAAHGFALLHKPYSIDGLSAALTEAVAKKG